jgi:ribosome-associated heat shock protein Hsp15
MRIDKLLWFLRFAKTRAVAQTWIENGHIRLDGRRIERSHVKVSAGSVMVLPLSGGVKVIEIVALPERRGPASEAQSCYRVLDERPAMPIAGDQSGIDAPQMDNQGDMPQ